MTKNELKKHCNICGGKVQQVNYAGAEPNDNVVITYKDELVVEIDFDANFVITTKREYEMSRRDWANVTVVVK